MNDAQVTLVFMVAAIVFTALALWRNKGLSLKALALVLASTAIVSGFLFSTL